MTGRKCVCRPPRSGLPRSTLPPSRAYLESGEYLGKAGAYAIQGRAGAFVEHLDGSYSGVMGLPLYDMPFY